MGTVSKLFSDGFGYPTLAMLRYRVERCTMFKVVEIDGYICEALDVTSPSPSEVLSEYFGRPVHLVVKGPKRRACNPTQTFPDLAASAVYQDGFPLLVASDESLEKVGDEINRWASGEVNGESIGAIDDLWKASRVPIERCVPVHPCPVCWGYEGGSDPHLNVLGSGQISYSAALARHLRRT